MPAWTSEDEAVGITAITVVQKVLPLHEGNSLGAGFISEDPLHGGVSGS